MAQSEITLPHFKLDKDGYIDMKFNFTKPFGINSGTVDDNH